MNKITLDIEIIEKEFHAQNEVVKSITGMDFRDMAKESVKTDEAADYIFEVTKSAWIAGYDRAIRNVYEVAENLPEFE